MKPLAYARWPGPTRRETPLFTLKKMAATAAGFVLAGGAVLAVAAPAGATTLTCTNIASAISGPIGCGGLQLGYTANGTLDLAGGGNYWNAPATVQLDSQANSNEDWTVYAISGSVTDGPGALGEFVAMYTPLGKIPSFTHVGGPGSSGTNATPVPGEVFTAGSSDYCLSVENIGTGAALRWKTVLRNCNSNGDFTEGANTGAAPFNAVQPGHANAYQVWAPVTGHDGLLMVNDSLSRGYKHNNTPYVLDDSGWGGAGTQAIAYPENDGTNQVWSVIGCTDPVKALNTGYQFCP